MAQVIIIVQHDTFTHYVFLTKDDNFHLLDVPMLCVCLIMCNGMVGEGKHYRPEGYSVSGP